MMKKKFFGKNETALIFDIWHVVKEFVLDLLRKIKNPTTYLIRKLTSAVCCMYCKTTMVMMMKKFDGGAILKVYFEHTGTCTVFEITTG